jgi:PD-(D/E)XK nuclease superfamily protein
MSRESRKRNVFSTFKKRGEWVELQFMAEAASRGFTLSKPWGESTAYDVGVEHGHHFLRVQVKSTTVRTGTGYFCQFKPNYHKKQDYTLQQLDLFAAYVIPVDAWYLIPAAVILGPQRKTGLMLFPMVPLKKDRYSYEGYKEAWPLLFKSRRALAARFPPR